MTALDLDHLRRWIGSTEQQTDLVTAYAVNALRGTLELASGEDAPAPEARVPITQHWCLALQTEPISRLARDGHARLGGFLPPVPLPRRMWAGGDLSFHDSLRVGDTVERVSRVVDVQGKQGRTGPLCFVTVAQEFSTARGLAVRETHVLVYRDTRDAGRPAETTPPDRNAQRTASEAAATPSQGEQGPTDWQCVVDIDAVRLFRYSALTFNGHRIHYDRDYCREEGYSGLLVHAPLQVSLLTEFAHSIKAGQAPRTFTYRAVRPLFDGTSTALRPTATNDGLDLWIAAPDGVTTMIAKAAW